MNTFLDFFNEDSFESSNKLRVRENTLKHGLAFPSDEELIMMILGSGTKEMPIKELARQVLSIVMTSNSDTLIENLQKIRGMGKSKALMIASALELGRRINRNPQTLIKTPSEVVPFIQNYAMQKQEHFLCISMNGAKEIISIRVICTGVSNMAIIEPREVFSEALKEHASAVILSHNHPSGNPAPSQPDVKVTLRLYRAAKLLGLALLDHIILAKTSYFSFLENSCLTEEKLIEKLLEKDSAQKILEYEQSVC
ncbi:MAG: DNA repair protein RadC [Treponema sp.]|nr:DNA repair protein RadC [Treponema sp.]